MPGTYTLRKYSDAELTVLGRVLRFTGDASPLRMALPSLALAVYPPGATVIREGETGTEMFVLLKGSVAVRRSFLVVFSREIARIDKPGDFFGEIGFLMPTVRSATVVADSVRGCEVFRLVPDDLQRLMRRYPEVRNKLEEAARNRIFGLTG